MGPFSLTFTEVNFLVCDRSKAPKRAVFAPPGTPRPRRQSMTPHRETQRFLVMFVPDLGMFVTFVLRSLIQAYPRSSRPRRAQRRTPPSASTSGRNQPITSTHENVTSQTFLQNRRTRPRHRSRTRRSESLSAGGDISIHFIRMNYNWNSWRKFFYVCCLEYYSNSKY